MTSPSAAKSGGPPAAASRIGGDLAEVVGAEDAGGDDRERLGVDVARVVELVDGAAGDAERLAGADVDRRALDRPGQHALEPVDRLLVAVVAVPGRDLRAGRNVELEHRDRTARLARPRRRNRIAIVPTLISSRVLVAIVLLLSSLVGKVT